MMPNRRILLLFIIQIIGVVYGKAGTGCTINVLNNTNEKYFPVMLNNRSSEFTFIIPNHGQIPLKTGDGITFLCPEKNYLIPTQSNFTYATCVQNTTLKIFRKNYNFDEILCAKTVHGDVQKTNKSCGDGYGKIINIGYRVTQKYFKQLILVCYDDKEGKTLYTQHIVHGEEIANKSDFKERLPFSVDGLPADVPANVAYKKAYQKSKFSSLLGSSRQAERFVNKKSFLARGHLSPDADFLFASSQLTTYFYINTCPQWQSINAGNWLHVEMSIRKAAEKYNTKFTIITGTHDVLELPDVNDNPIEIYLVSNKKLPVPKFIWKVALNEDTGKGIVFVSINDPFIEKVTKDDLLCTNICDNYGWGTKSLDNISRGYTYCCDVNELSGVIKTMPSIQVNGILNSSP
ncbi:uncharacterized protein LOC130892963 [Diorhabda carinulata]|uniref:uncharacterized protein LOC130892963 n=1 Tax=Diorhabda carinulata TaxID=1163345 RepID=UPI0025A22EA8|nr:uncharacterized protein LOC130892963 [Diorhabda carinulata]